MSLSYTTTATMPQNGNVAPARLEPISVVDETTNRRYALYVAQQPKRARMCGFGDKDRRPITPPPCVRLIITDITTGKEVDVNEIDHQMYVINVDLWSEEGEREVNLIRHSSTAPSISATTSVPFSAMFEQQQAPPPYPALMSSTREPEQYRPPQAGLPYPTASHQMQQQPPMSRPPMPPSHMSQPHMGQPHMNTAQMSPHPQMSHPQQLPHSHMAPPLPPAHYPPPPVPSPVPSQYGQPTYSPATQYFPGSRDYSDPNGVGQRFSAPDPYGAMQRPGASDPGAGPSGMFTRNLIGSLAASAFRLEDAEKRIGIWFVLQDLSVRTEGNFRLRFSFVNVGAPSSQAPSVLPTTSSGTVNTKKAPILAAVFSDTFSVFSAKKFPGVCESTALSKAFAMQGIKIPVRKDVSGKEEEDDYA